MKRDFNDSIEPFSTKFQTTSENSVFFPEVKFVLKKASSHDFIELLDRSLGPFINRDEKLEGGRK